MPDVFHSAFRVPRSALEMTRRRFLQRTSGGLGVAEFVNTGGTQYVSYGGVVSGVTVSGGVQILTDANFLVGGGTAFGDLVESGGQVCVFHGGTTSAGTILSGGTDGEDIDFAGLDLRNQRRHVGAYGIELPADQIEHRLPARHRRLHGVLVQFGEKSALGAADRRRQPRHHVAVDLSGKKLQMLRESQWQ